MTRLGSACVFDNGVVDDGSNGFKADGEACPLFLVVLVALEALRSGLGTPIDSCAVFIRLAGTWVEL